MSDFLATRLYQGWSSGDEVAAEAVRLTRMAVALDKNDLEAIVELAWEEVPLARLEETVAILYEALQRCTLARRRSHRLWLR
jgi:hypothetical protein